MKKEISKSEGYVCPKCSCNNYEVDSIKVINGNILSFKKGPSFKSMTCSKCKYTEFYKE
ncbi:MAG: hypothetical protein ACD_51C00249G0018 [uncultured bacterium]|nr:MAG: hypothetical protein ACD_51C00249G0018 [uncultured bacterium]